MRGMMKLMMYLYNLCIRKVGINQILNVYMLVLNANVNQVDIHYLGNSNRN
jgi:hypothetical protein